MNYLSKISTASLCVVFRLVRAIPMNGKLLMESLMVCLNCTNCFQKNSLSSKLRLCIEIKFSARIYDHKLLIIMDLFPEFKQNSFIFRKKKPGEDENVRLQRFYWDFWCVFLMYFLILFLKFSDYESTLEKMKNIGKIQAKLLQTF